MSTDSWQRCTIDQIKADVEGSIAIGPFGSRMKSDRYVSSGVPVIRGMNISETRALSGEFVCVSEETADELRSSNVFPGDLVFPHRGAIGEVGIVPAGSAERYILSTSLMKLTCNLDLVDPLFIFYFFRSGRGRHELLKHASTVGTPGIGQPLTSLRSISMQLPPLGEQRAIAEILGALDDKIDLNRRLNQTLEAMTQALFKSWFVDFDPVRAQTEGRQPAGIDPALAATFPDSFDNSILGPVPTGWAVRPLPELVEINPTRRLAAGAVAPYVEMANLPTSSARVLGWDSRRVGSGMKFINGDVLVARITPCLENGKTAYVDFLRDDQTGWGSTEYIVLRSKTPLPRPYAYFLARSDTFRAHAIKNMSGTSGRQRVPADCLNRFPVVVPPQAILDRFGVFASSALSAMRAHDDESLTLGSVRDALLPKLLSGEIRIKDAEKVAAAAV